METFDEIILLAKGAYKKSILDNCEKLQDDLLSIITIASQLKHELSVKRTPLVRRENIEDSKYKDVAVVAYVLSEFGHQVFNADLTQAQVIEKLANILNVKATTLRNIRDALDSYTNSNREGWKKPLPKRLQVVFDECVKTYPPEDTIKEAKSILRKYEKGNNHDQD